MKRIFISSVQKEFERERAAIKRMVESDPILKPHFSAFVFEIDAPATDKTTQQVYLKEIERCDIYLLLVGNKYGYCKDGEVSPTEQEFDKAQELGLTKIVFVRGTDNSKRDERETRFLIVIWRPKAVANRGANRGANLLDSLPAEQRRICEELLANPRISSRAMAKELGIRRNTVLKQLEALKLKGILIRKGGTRGFWEIST